MLQTSQLLMHLPYAHSSLIADTYKNQVHLETSGEKNLTLIYFKG